MVKNKPILTVLPRLDYMAAKGKWDTPSENARVKALFWNDKYDVDNMPNFADLHAQLQYKHNAREGRDLIIGIPHKIKDDVKAQENFVKGYMLKLERRLGIPPEKHLWAGAIHNQERKDKKTGQIKTNLHAHVLMAERLPLKDIVYKECRARHYKGVLGYDIPKHTERIAFGGLIKDPNPSRSGKSRGLFDGYAFSKISNEVWREHVKELHLEQKVEHKAYKDYMIPFENHHAPGAWANIQNKRNVRYNELVQRSNDFVRKHDYVTANDKNGLNSIKVLFKELLIGPKPQGYSIGVCNNIWRRLKKEERIKRLEEFIDKVVDPIEKEELINERDELENEIEHEM